MQRAENVHSHLVSIPVSAACLLNAGMSLSVCVCVLTCADVFHIFAFLSELSLHNIFDNGEVNILG